MKFNSGLFRVVEEEPVGITEDIVIQAFDLQLFPDPYPGQQTGKTVLII